MKHRKLETIKEISNRMSNVKLKKNKYEIMLAKALWHKGYRYRLNYKELPGSPDIAIIKYQIAIFIDGEFWHGKDFDERKSKIKNNKEYWIEKIQENIDRDTKNDKLLRMRSWIPLHFWSYEVEKYLDICIQTVEEFISYLNE